MSISWICTAQVDCWREIYFFTQNLANCEQISRQQYTWNLMIQLYLAENRSSTKKKSKLSGASHAFKFYCMYYQDHDKASLPCNEAYV